MTAEETFAQQVGAILAKRFGPEPGAAILVGSPLIRYLVTKTQAANRGSKSRGSFANLYAIYVLVEDYLAHGYPSDGDYSTYEGARFSDLFQRQRELPFGEKLQNHALNGRLNDEFRKYYPNLGLQPIIRDLETQRYWINEQLLISAGTNIASAVIDIIDAYVNARRDSFVRFIEDTRRLQNLPDTSNGEKRAFRSLSIDSNHGRSTLRDRVLRDHEDSLWDKDRLAWLHTRRRIRAGTGALQDRKD